MDSNILYFTCRASEERDAAMRAEHPKAREAHLELARRYQDLATGIAARERYLGPNLSVTWTPR